MNDASKVIFICEECKQKCVRIRPHSNSKAKPTVCENCQEIRKRKRLKEKRQDDKINNYK